MPMSDMAVIDVTRSTPACRKVSRGTGASAARAFSKSTGTPATKRRTRVSRRLPERVAYSRRGLRDFSSVTEALPNKRATAGTVKFACRSTSRNTNSTPGSAGVLRRRIATCLLLLSSSGADDRFLPTAYCQPEDALERPHGRRPPMQRRCADPVAIRDEHFGHPLTRQSRLQQEIDGQRRAIRVEGQRVEHRTAIGPHSRVNVSGSHSYQDAGCKREKPVREVIRQRHGCGLV